MHIRAIACILLIFIASGCANKKQKDDPGKEKQVRKEELPAGQPLPRLTVRDGAVRDLGEIREGIRTSVTFTLVNEGKADAKNISVHDLSQGGCTAVSEVSYLAAGDSAKLEFIFETLGYGGQKPTREVKVRYGNPEHSPMTLSVTADVLPVKAHQVPIGELYYNFFVLVDIRDSGTFRKGHIAGAIHVPAAGVADWVSMLPKDFMIYLYSDEGKESDELALELQNNGYTEALSIIGGIGEWKRRYGERFIIEGPR